MSRLDDFQKSFWLSMALLAGLLFVDRLPELMDRVPSLHAIVAHPGHLHRLANVPVDLHKTDLNAEDMDALAAGYYEGLEPDAGPAGMPAEREDVRFRNDFLRYELRPNVNHAYAAGIRFTNSFGLANPEYAYDKPPGTRRIALLGDSVALGPYGHDYPALLEASLNQTGLSAGIKKFEVLNFGVYGYSAVQMMYVALEKAPAFHPDVYFVAMTSLEVMNIKSGSPNHMARLVMSGADLKYPFLRDIASQAGVKAGDHLTQVRVKLAPYLRQVTKWALEQIRDHASKEGASMVIAFVPAAINPEFSATDFDKLHAAADSLGVPILDLRDAFKSVKLQDVQVIPDRDVHPNGKGHELIYEKLTDRLRTNPQAWRALTGN